MRLIRKRDEAITNPRNRFNVTRRVCRVSQRVAQFLDGFIQAVVEIDEYVGWPKALSEFLASDDLAGSLQK